MNIQCIPMLTQMVIFFIFYFDSILFKKKSSISKYISHNACLRIYIYNVYNISRHLYRV